MLLIISLSVTADTYDLSVVERGLVALLLLSFGCLASVYALWLTDVAVCDCGIS